MSLRIELMRPFFDGHYSHDPVSKASGITPARLSSIRCGWVTPTQKERIALCRTFCCHESELIDEIDRVLQDRVVKMRRECAEREFACPPALA